MLSTATDTIDIAKGIKTPPTTPSCHAAHSRYKSLAARYNLRERRPWVGPSGNDCSQRSCQHHHRLLTSTEHQSPAAYRFQVVTIDRVGLGQHGRSHDPVCPPAAPLTAIRAIVAQQRLDHLSDRLQRVECSIVL
jgi:hypothetical protein